MSQNVWPDINKRLERVFMTTFGIETVSKFSVFQKKAIPFEIKRLCRAFEFKCFSSVASPKMRSLFT